LPLVAFGAAITVAGGISFYASTLARNTLEALSLAVLGVLITWVFVVMVNNHDIYFPALDDLKPWQFALTWFCCIMVLAATLLILAVRNLKCLTVTPWIVLQNILVLASVLGLIEITLRWL
jgi:hypothetical protein